ncbi:hypothetical protein EVB53_107 [Rhizobium phage RHph_Y60]|nr:hypothetical protein EVB53_107 [Rhizobium phage RHph_Y60]
MIEQLARLRRFVDLIEARAMACDGPVTPFIEELNAASDREKGEFITILQELYRLPAPPVDKIEELKRAAAPLVAIADAYDANDLDDEARKFWGPNGIQHVNTTPPEKIELYTGRGGKQLLTLAHCFRARDAAR